MRYAILAVLCVLGLFAAAQAPENAVAPPAAPEAAPQNPPPAGPGPGRAMNESTRELLEQVMVARLSKELTLDDEQTVLLVRAVSEFRDQMADLRRQRMQLSNELKGLVKEGKDNDAIEAKLQVLISHDEKTAVARRDLFERASAGLTPWQRAKLYLFMGDFEGEIKRLLKKAQDRVSNMRDGEPGNKNPLGRPRPGMRGPRPEPGLPPGPPDAGPAPVAPPPAAPQP